MGYSCTSGFRDIKQEVWIQVSMFQGGVGARGGAGLKLFQEGCKAKGDAG